MPPMEIIFFLLIAALLRTWFLSMATDIGLLLQMMCVILLLIVSPNSQVYFTVTFLAIFVYTANSAK